MTVPMPDPPVAYGGCPWPMDAACLAEDWEGLDPAIRTRALALASSTLRRLTAYRVGGCPVTVRPCAPRAYCAPFVPFRGSYGSDWMYPGINAQGLWVNSCGCSGNCGCSITKGLALPLPIGRVDEVKVDGNVIPSTDYEVRDGLLIYIGSDLDGWPATQNLDLPDSLPGTFSVTYLNSYPVDMAGAQAVAYLAMEFAKACKGKGKCSLPRNVTDVVRNGVSFTIQAGLFPEGRTSIEVVDAFIELWNPGGRTQPTKVWTPDMARVHR